MNFTLRSPWDISPAPPHPTNSNLIYSEPTFCQANGKFNLSHNRGSFPGLYAFLKKRRIFAGHPLVFSLHKHVHVLSPHSPLTLRCLRASGHVRSLLRPGALYGGLISKTEQRGIPLWGPGTAWVSWGSRKWMLAAPESTGLCPLLVLHIFPVLSGLPVSFYCPSVVTSQAPRRVLFSDNALFFGLQDHTPLKTNK